MPIPNRTVRTQEDYERKARSYGQRVARLYGHTSPANVGPLTLAEHLVAEQPHYSKGSWRVYRSAIRYHLERWREQEPSGWVVEEIDAALALLSSAAPFACQRKGTRTSANKAKSLHADDLSLLLHHLEEHSDHRYSELLRYWLVAGQLTGLRPCEWQHAHLIEWQGRPLLVAYNAKHTNGRGLGRLRALDLSGMDDKDREAIATLLRLIQEGTVARSFAQLQKATGDALRVAARASLGQRKRYPSLYSLRHQFAADAKASGLSKAEVAALMGHASENSAGYHYARKVSGRGGLAARPLVVFVKEVRPSKPAWRTRKLIP
jgi:integrase